MSEEICNKNNSAADVDADVEDDAAVIPMVIVVKRETVAAAEVFMTCASGAAILAGISIDIDDGFEADIIIEVDEVDCLDSE